MLTAALLVRYAYVPPLPLSPMDANPVLITITLPPGARTSPCTACCTLSGPNVFTSNAARIRPIETASNFWSPITA